MLVHVELFALKSVGAGERVVAHLGVVRERVGDRLHGCGELVVVGNIRTRYVMAKVIVLANIFCRQVTNHEVVPSQKSVDLL